LGLLLGFIGKAKKGKNFYIRSIPGLEAMDEAIGRATEMGKPVLYVSGLDDITSVATIASVTILGRVAKRTAEYETTLIIPCYDPVVMAVEQEVVKAAYSEIGRLDAYREENIFFVSATQFAYTAAVDGIMLRDQQPIFIWAPFMQNHWF